MPHPAPTEDETLALLARHGLPGARVEASPHEGSVNHVRMVGEWCVRVLKEEDYASDVYTEVVAVPALRAVGVRTPELVAFDDSRTVVPGLVTIYRRVPGVPLGTCGRIEGLEEMVRSVGREIVLWRSKVSTVEDPNGWLDRPRGDDVWRCYERAAERLSPAERAWTEGAIRRLESARQPAPQFVHWDLHAFNVLVAGGFTTVLDWGDSGFGDPTLNYRLLPASWLPLLLESVKVDGDFVGRCLYGLLGYALNDVHLPPRGESPYAHTGHRRWESLKALARQPLSSEWRDWLGDGPS